MPNERPKKKVTREEFLRFLSEYPKKLVRDVAGMLEPPIVSYNDFSIAPMWPDSIVAYYIDFEHSSIPSENDYYVYENDNSD